MKSDLNFLNSLNSLNSFIIILLILLSYYFILYQFKSKINKVSIISLYCYPIKSCQGIKMNTITINLKGFQYDREFAIINYMNEVITLRSRPKLATISTLFSNDFKELIIINNENKDEIRIQLENEEEEKEKTKNYTRYLKLRLWDDLVDGYEVDTKVSEWFSKIIGEHLKFVRISSSFKRETNKKYIENGQTGLADEFPFLMISQGSFDDFKGRIENKKVYIENFRPNIVVSGCEPYQEDQMEAVITPNGTKLTVAKLCDRCSLPNVHPFKGIMDTSLTVTKTLKKYRSGKHLRLKSEWSDKLFFGVHLDHQSTAGEVLSVGDELEIVW